MSTIQRALIAASFVLIATAGAQAQAPAHSGGAVAIGADSASGLPVARPQAHGAAPVQNFGAVAIGSDGATGQSVVRYRAAPAPRYQGSTEGARAIGSDR
jgi:hypothetical protein